MSDAQGVRWGSSAPGWLWLVCACSTACGGTSGPHEPRVMPTEATDRHAAMDAFGQRLHAALVVGTPEVVLLDDMALRAILRPEAATRVASRRATMTMRIGRSPRTFGALAQTTYLGVCLQDARDEADGALGLAGPGWTFRRVLVAARQPTGRRIGLWVDGIFVYTDTGFVALDLERVEDPRWEHSDLDLSPCDMATTLR